MSYNSTPDPIRPEVELTLAQWRDKATNLWKLLDDISTYFDMFKPEMETFERRVWKKCEERHKELTSDGYRIFPI